MSQTTHALLPVRDTALRRHPSFTLTNDTLLFLPLYLCTPSSTSTTTGPAPSRLPLLLPTTSTSSVIMSALRLLPLLLALLVSCVGLPVAVRAGDPTAGCNLPVGDPGTGVWAPSDVGYYDIIGLESYASSSYSIMCAYRAQYAYGPNSQTNVWGPWHGNKAEDPTDCTGPNTYYFSDTTTWPENGYGSLQTRTNAATGKQVVVQLQLGSVCDENDLICAGICYYNSDYASAQKVLQADPTVKTTYFTKASNTIFNVYTTLNATASTNTTIRSPQPQYYPDKVLSVITSIQECYGYANVTC